MKRHPFLSLLQGVSRLRQKGQMSMEEAAERISRGLLHPPDREREERLSTPATGPTVPPPPLFELRSGTVRRLQAIRRSSIELTPGVLMGKKRRGSVPPPQVKNGAATSRARARRLLRRSQ